MAPATDTAALLQKWLQHDKKLVTYRLLSRELRIHVDEAKKALASFFESHKDNSDLDATYILIGTSTFTPPQPEADTTAKDDEDQDGDDKPVGSSSTPSSSTAPTRSFLDSRVTRRQTQANVARQVIRLVSAEELDSARSSFEKVSSCHVYSISPGRLRDAAQLTAIQHDLHTQQKYTDAWAQTNRGADLGVVINPNIKDNYDPTKAIPSLGGPSVPALPASKDSKAVNSSSNAKTQIKQESDTKTSSTTSAKSATAASSAPSGGKKSGLDWSRAKPKESESKAAAAVKKEPSSSAKRSSARRALLGSDDEDNDDDNSSRKPIVVDDDDDDDEDEGKPEKLGYADDDDDDIEMADPIRGAAPRGTGKRADARSQTRAQQATQRKELEAMMDSDGDDGDVVQVVEPSGTTGNANKTGQGKDLDPDVEMADSTVTDTMNGSANGPSAPKRRVRKKRKIGSKKVRTKDERGYTVTKTVDEYESYSSDESDTPVVVGSKRATSGAAKQSTTESRSTSTSASASPAPVAPTNSTPAASNNSSGLRKPSSGATPTPAKKGQQSLNSFFTRKPKEK